MLGRAAVHDHDGPQFGGPGQALARAVRVIHGELNLPGLVPADPRRLVDVGRAGVLDPGVEGRVERGGQAGRGRLEAGRARVAELRLERTRAGQAVPVDDRAAERDVPGHGVLARGPYEHRRVQVGRAALLPGRAELPVG